MGEFTDEDVERLESDMYKILKGGDTVQAVEIIMLIINIQRKRIDELKRSVGIINIEHAKF